jgi:hypothetical protein
MEFACYVCRKPNDYRYFTITTKYDPKDPNQSMMPNVHVYEAIFRAETPNEAQAKANEYIKKIQDKTSLSQQRKLVEAQEAGSYLLMPDGTKAKIDVDPTLPYKNAKFLTGRE